MRKLVWLVTGPGRDGVHAVPLTAGGKLVLVRLTYARGWRLPGGGRKRGETEQQGAIRELREEIGLVGHGSVERVDHALPSPRPRGDRSAMFLVRDVDYRPFQSLEVEEVREFDPAHLPEDLSPSTRETLDKLAMRRDE
ncbi:MAG TPA: NUDIX domain-containing protein [Allosphingosinicella sp.]|nr:NUDIX domain-containing protein [Allosphingosinicella sp.]